MKNTINEKNNNGSTPLHYAAINGYGKMVLAIIKKGADVNAKDKDGVTPLHLASQEGFF